MELLEVRESYLALRREIGKIIVGQDDLVESVLVAIFSGWHVLLEWVPGLAKTLLAETLGRVLDLPFSRIQFTPDLLPSDITGSEIFNMETWVFRVKKWPIFASIVLADEINRAPSKVQSALLEAMQERQVTLAGETHDLPYPFFVIATANPLDNEGTYTLPEASLDRFLSKICVRYPEKSQEMEIVRRMTEGVHELPKRSITKAEFKSIRDTIESSVFVDQKIIEYSVDIVRATRDPASLGLTHLVSRLSHGASVRASLALVSLSKTFAAFSGREYVLPEDIKHVAFEVLRHRIGLSFEAIGSSVDIDDIIREILHVVRVP